MGTRYPKAIFCRSFVAMQQTWALALLLAITGCSSAIIDLRHRAWGSLETANLDGVVQASIDPDKAATCQEEQCSFSLHYFVGGNRFFKSRKTILYISGGPGSVVSPDNRDLAFLEDLELYNVVYVDLRGAGGSQLPMSNSYDKYLRAEYAARDIEVLRQWLGIEFWDAIYAHSFGTVVAQKYAVIYAQKQKDNPTPRVLKVILSAPLARHLELESDRRLQRIKNLDSVYSYFSRDCSCPAEEAPQNTNPSEAAGEEARINRVKDFCFLSSAQIKIIKTRLADIMKSLEDEYGSLRMVSEHYQELIRTSFAESYPFPKGFFSALTVLESHGPPKDVAKFLKGLPPEQQKEREKFIEEAFNKKTFAAAFVLGYFTSTNYLKIQKLREACHGEPKCMAETKDALDTIREFKMTVFPADFLNPDVPDCLGHTKHSIHSYVATALRTLTMSDSELSLRAYYVFGLYDGISGWLAKQTGASLEEGQAIPCVPAEAIANVAPNLVVRKHLDRIGIAANESICPWNPSNYKHSLPTLILRGGADPVTAGGQAEYFFKNGLTGDRILIELNETGHSMMLVFEEQVALAIILQSFLDNQSIEEMLKDPKARICSQNSYYQVKQVVAAGGGGCPPL